MANFIVDTIENQKLLLNESIQLLKACPNYNDKERIAKIKAAAKVNKEKISTET